MQNIWNKVEPYTSTCIATVLKEGKHEEEVVIGGLITSVVNMIDIAEGIEKNKEDDAGVYLTVDDGIDEISVLLTKRAYENYIHKEETLSTGDLILFKGAVQNMKLKHSYTKNRKEIIVEDGHPEQEKRVVAFAATKIPV